MDYGQGINYNKDVHPPHPLLAAAHFCSYVHNVSLIHSLCIMWLVEKHTIGPSVQLKEHRRRSAERLCL